MNKDKMERHAVIAESVYMKPEERQAYINRHYPDEYKLLDEHTSDGYSAFKHMPSGKVVFGIRGTDIQDTQGGRLKDLAEDALIIFGLDSLSSRTKESDKKLQELIDEHGKDNITLTGHSLGGNISQGLSIKHGIESHAYNPGSSPHSSRNKLFQYVGSSTARKRAKDNHVYYTKPKGSSVDWLSVSGLAHPLQNTHLVPQKNLTKEKGGVLSPHSIHHFVPLDVETAQATREALDKIQKTQKSRVTEVVKELKVPETLAAIKAPAKAKAKATKAKAAKAPKAVKSLNPAQDKVPMFEIQGW